MRALAFLLAAALPLSACGLQPMYAGGGSGPVAQGLAAVEVGPIALVGEVAHVFGERRLDVENVDLQAGVLLELADHVAYAML